MPKNCATPYIQNTILNVSRLNEIGVHSYKFFSEWSRGKEFSKPNSYHFFNTTKQKSRINV